MDSTKTISMGELISFAEDPAFKQCLSYDASKSGITFKANYGGKVITTGTHRKHNKSYDGVDRNFKRNFGQMIGIVFGLYSIESPTR